ncbi:MAG TPA: helix-turn-helix domain-containing protein, partial [Actinomycetes bacterium]|nr:helix-turn-helix domain-containing protein [Actinomycetes bacterium]
MRAYGLSVEQQDEVWQRWRAGEALRSVARELGAPVQHVRRYVAQTGGVRPRPAARSARHLLLAEREEVSRGLAAGWSLRRIAAQLGRPHSTLSREVARNGGREAYRAHDADAAAYERARRPKAGKLWCRPELLAAVQRGLELEWSPEQVSQRLRLEYPDDPSMSAPVNLSEADSFGNHWVVGVSSFGSLIHTAVGRAGGWGGLRTKRSGC